MVKEEFVKVQRNVDVRDPVDVDGSATHLVDCLVEPSEEMIRLNNYLNDLGTARAPGEHLKPLERAVVRLARLFGDTLERAGDLVGCRVGTALRLCQQTSTVPIEVDEDDDNNAEQQASYDRIAAALAADIGLSDDDKRQRDDLIGKASDRLAELSRLVPLSR